MKKFEQAKSLYAKMSNQLNENRKVDDIFISAIMSEFDRLFELTWKSLKEYMYVDLGMREAKTGYPKQIIKLAYAQNLIHQSEMWIQILEDRNDDTHVYNETAARSYVSRIRRDYMPFLGNVYQELSAYIPEEKDILVQIPESFLLMQEKSGIEFDMFLQKMLSENECRDELEVYSNWDDIKKNMNSF